jgi:gliding motility-associated-like protein
VDEGIYSFQIYNRWGQLVFETNDPEVGWDGQQFGREVDEGIYTYVVRFFTNVQRVNTVVSDSFTLLR